MTIPSTRTKDGAKVLITADEATIGKKTFPLKERVDKALDSTTIIQHVLVAKRTGKKVSMRKGRDISLDKVRQYMDVCVTYVPFAVYVFLSKGNDGGVH